MRLSQSILLSLLPASLAFYLPPGLHPRDDTHPANLLKSDPLAACLAKGNLTLIFPSSPLYPSHSRAFNRRYTYSPAVIVYPKTQRQVSHSVGCARNATVKVQARSGGHSYAAFGLGGKDGSMVVDLEAFQSVTLQRNANSTDVSARVGAGIRLGNLATKLFELGGRAIPHGTCPGVGVGGHALHGGFGPTSRNWGLTVDVIEKVEGVTADGRSFTASLTENSELFWALRGAGASIAIVTHFTFKTFPAPAKTVNFDYGFSFQDADAAARAFLAWQEFGRTSAPKELWLQVYVESYFMSIAGAYYGPRAEFDRLIQPLYDQLQQIYGKAPTTNVRDLAWVPTLERLAGGELAVPMSGPYEEFDTFYVKSLVVPEDSVLKEETVKSLYRYMFTQGRASKDGWYVIANLYGGPESQINAVPIGATSYGHRNSNTVFQIYGFTPNHLPPFSNSITTVIEGIYNSIASKQSPADGGDWPAYANYVDSSYGKKEAGERYYGENLRRLRKAKRRFDPRDLFWNPQSIQA